MNDQEKKAFDTKVEDAIQEYLKRTPSRCMFPNCEEDAINSHSISDKKSLGKIIDGKKGHLCTPRSKRVNFDREMYIGQRGISESSTFKGFCKDHDKMFNRLDTAAINSLKDIYLQAYRTISYARFQDYVANVYEPMLDEGFPDFLKSDIANLPIIIEIINNLRKESIALTEQRLERIDKYQQAMYRRLNMFDDKVDASSSRIIIDNQIPLNIAYKKLGFQIPAAVNSKVSITLGNTEYYVFVICMPNESTTDFMLMIDRNIKMEHTEYLTHIIDDDITILSIIEKSMVMSDQWWIKPSVYKSLSEEKRKIIIEDLFCFADCNFFSEYELSIFDDLRIKLLNQTQDEYRKLYEMNKINKLPVREVFEERKRKFQEKIGSQFYGQ